MKLHPASTDHLAGYLFGLQTVSMRSSEEIQAEISQKLGFFPTFFAPALQNPLVLENLWQQTLCAYINNPLSALFKEKLSAYLSRYCAVPYCMIWHSCSLPALGMKPQEVLELLELPTPTLNDIDTHLNRLAELLDGLTVFKANSDIEESLLYCSAYVFLERDQSEYVLSEMRRLLGDENYQYLVMFISYVKMCHGWIKAHPEIAIEADKRVAENLGAMLAQSPDLANFFDNYRERVSLELQRRHVEQMAELIERKRFETEQQKLVTLVENSSDFIAIATLEGQALFVNEAGQKLVGLDGINSVTRTKVSEYFMPEDRDYFQQNILPTVFQDGRWEGDFRFRHFKSFGAIAVHCNFFTIKNKQMQPIAIATVSRDITERFLRLEKERSQLLEREHAARIQAETANRLKDEFLATLSHELRSPLNAMLGWVQMLRRGTLDAASSQRALETIERNARVQNQLIEDLLDVSRIITGKLRLEVRPVSLVSVISAVIETVRPAAEAKAIELVSVIDPDAGLVAGDSNRLQQVVWNLVFNAIKFTEEGGRVLLQLERINSHVEIIVSDTGQGIPAEVLPHVFERFCQADSSSSRAHTGLGLGLAIVRQLVELHGGTVIADSQGLGLGSTFTVRLPVRAVRREDSHPERVHPTLETQVPFECISRLNGLRILVVDDEADVRDLLTVVLEECGALVVAVATAREARAALKESKLDVLVSDIGMPGEDGYALMRSIRALDAEHSGRIPAVALTAYARVQDRQQAMLAGFQTHLSKPVEPGELVAVVANLSGRSLLLAACNDHRPGLQKG